MPLLLIDPSRSSWQILPRRLFSGVTLVIAMTFVCICPLIAQDTPADAGNQGNASGAQAQVIAGKNLAEYSAELSSENRIVRLRAAKSLIAFAAPAIPSLRETLEHDDAAMRYVAAVGLGDLTQSDDDEKEPERLLQLREMVAGDSSAAVQMAAAYAICKYGDVQAGLPILVDRLRNEERGMVCSAAELLGKLGADAKDATAVLQEVFANNDPAKRNGDYHKGGAAKKALRMIRDSRD